MSKTNAPKAPKAAPARPAAQRKAGPNPLAIALNVLLVGVSVFLVTRHADAFTDTWSKVRAHAEDRLALFGVDSFGSTAVGHVDFADGRSRRAGKEFLKPESDALRYVNVNLGNGG